MGHMGFVTFSLNDLDDLIRDIEALADIREGPARYRLLDLRDQLIKILRHSW